MATKFKYVCIRFLDEEKIIEPEIEVLVKITDIIRLEWDAEYVDFRYVSTSSDPDVKYTVSALRILIEEGLFPTEGSFSLLGGKNSIVQVKPYSIEEFCTLCKNASTLSIIVDDLREIDNCKDIFGLVHIKPYVDYSELISILEKGKLLTTFPSTTYLSVDGRRFALSPCVTEYNPLLQKYIGENYEVDSLGTGFFKDLTEEVVKLLICFKAVKGSHKDAETQQIDNDVEQNTRSIQASSSNSSADHGKT